MRRIDILPGEQHGCYTVMGKSSKTGKQDFFAVRCKCGCETVIGKSQLLSNPQRCRQCAGRRYTAMMQDKRKEMVGQTVNGFRIIDIAPSGTGAAKFVVECVICGNRSVKTISAMKYKKGERCEACPPDYHFEVIGDYAVGQLDDGTVFKIDPEDIPLVQPFHWYVNAGGYLFRRDAATREPYRMHRVVMGLSAGDNLVVDHLNHDKLDNRKCNLSVGTQADNCLNNIKRASNTVGYVGIHVSRSGNTFTSFIEKSGKAYELIRTSSIEDAAQAYNVAADYLFGVGVGYRNRVVYPTQQFACSVVEKIKAIQKADAHTNTGG